MCPHQRRSRGKIAPPAGHRITVEQAAEVVQQAAQGMTGADRLRLWREWLVQVPALCPRGAALHCELSGRPYWQFTATSIMEWQRSPLIGPLRLLQLDEISAGRGVQYLGSGNTLIDFKQVRARGISLCWCCCCNSGGVSEVEGSLRLQVAPSVA